MLLPLQLLLLSAGLAALLAASPRALPLPRHGRALLGAALAPCALGGLALLLMAAWPGAHRAVHAGAPLAVGVALLAWRGLALRPSRWRRGGVGAGAAVAVVALLLMLLVARFAPIADAPLSNTDALQYLAQARQMDDVRDLRLTAGIAGLPDGSLRGDSHGPLWVAYLSSAGTSAAGVAVGPARLLYLGALLSLAAAAAAFGSGFRLRWLGVLMVVSLASVPHLTSSLSGSRDAFRLTSLLALMAFLLAHLGNRRRIRAGEVGLCTLLCAAAMQGHGLAVVLVPVTVAGWFALGLWLRTAGPRLAALPAAAVLGCTLGIAHLLGAYVDTGRPMGNNVVAEDQVAGTVYAAGLAARNRDRIGAGHTAQGRLEAAVGRNGGWPGVAALASMALLLAAAWWRGPSALRTDRRAWPFLLVGTWFVLHTLFLLGAFDVGGMAFGAWTVLNPRYAMQWHLVAGALVAATACLAVQRSLALPGLRVPGTGRAAAAAALAAFAGLQLWHVRAAWELSASGVYRDASIRLAAEAAALPAGCRLLSEDTGFNYYAQMPVVQLYSRPMNALLRAPDAAVVVRLLDERRLCAVVLYEGMYIDRAGSGTPLLQALEDPTLFRRVEALPWRFYLRTQPLAAATGSPGPAAPAATR